MKYGLHRFAAMVLCIGMIAGNGISSFAAGEVKEIVIDKTTADGKEKTELQILEETQAAAKAIPIETNELKGWPEGPEIYGEAGIVMDMDTGAILYAKAVDDKHYPASITKILTALLALENSQMTDTVTFSEDSIYSLEPGYAHIGMKPGEEITMKDALHALMLASANEVAYAIGETVGGTHDHFVQMMNDRAKELGCENTHFINTNGMFDEDHYTSARDMALIAREAFSHQELLNIVQTLQYTIPPTNLEEEPRIFQQKHKMMLQGEHFDECCIGGKTGYTEKANNTLVTVMEKDGKRIVTVILTSRKETFEDTKKLCDYAFNNFEHISIAENETSERIGGIARDANVTLPKGITFSDLTWEADKNGKLSYFYEGQLAGTTQATVEPEKEVTGKDEKEPEKEQKGLPAIFTILLALAAAVCVAVTAVTAVLVRRKRARERRRRERQRRRRNQRNSRNRRRE